MKTHHDVIRLKTAKKCQFVDLTEKIKKIVGESKIHDGIVNIVSLHTTTAILLNENEPLLLGDFADVVKSLLASFEAGDNIGPLKDLTPYRHDDIKRRRKVCPELDCNECKNADAHCRSIFLTNSQTLNIVDGKLYLGRWQSILFFELDQPKKREISVMVMGEFD